MAKRRIRFGFLLIVVWLMVGCGSTESVHPERAEVAETPLPTATVPPTAIPATDIPPTTAPTGVPTEAATLPPPATFTPEPAQPLPTAIPTVPLTATPEPTAEPTIEATVAVEEGACAPREQVADMVSPFGVVPGAWARGGASSAEVYTGNTANKMIHLGFDVEGNPDHLGEILDILDRHNVKTTMFILGNWAYTYPDWIEEFAARGHEFANHTWTHSDLGKMTSEQVIGELNRTEAFVMQLTGQSTKPWMRPPFGSRSDVSINAAFEAGWTTVIWSGSTDDWRTEFDEDDMCRTLVETSYPGGILYTHTSRPEIPAVLDRYLGTMQAQGYTFVPLSVIMSNSPEQYLVQQDGGE